MEELLEYNNPNIPDWIEVFYMPLKTNQAIDVALVAVLFLIGVDLLSGMLQAVINKNFSSTKIREGLIHKCSELLVLLVGLILDALIFSGVDLGIGFDFNAPVTLIAAISIVIMELASIMENLIKINPGLKANPIFKALAAAHVIKSGENVEVEPADEEIEEEDVFADE